MARPPLVAPLAIALKAEEHGKSAFVEALWLMVLYWLWGITCSSLPSTKTWTLISSGAPTAICDKSEWEEKFRLGAMVRLIQSSSTCETSRGMQGETPCWC